MKLLILVLQLSASFIEFCCKRVDFLTRLTHTLVDESERTKYILHCTLIVLEVNFSEYKFDRFTRFLYQSTHNDQKLY